MSYEPEDRQRYQAAFDKLPWVQREVFQLHCLDGLTYAQIAWLLRVSERFVERQMARALYKLSKQMDGLRLDWWERLF